MLLQLAHPLALAHAQFCHPGPVLSHGSVLCGVLVLTSLTRQQLLLGFPSERAVVLQALDDFRDRIAKYEEVYETITDRNLHYIKLIDMCDS